MATETKEKRKGAEEQVQVKWYGYIALLVGILFFSGLFQKAPGALKALDFNNVMGSFGTLGELTKGSGTLAEISVESEDPDRRTDGYMHLHYCRQLCLHLVW